MTDQTDRVTQTIDRLISNLPSAIARLREVNLTSLPLQLEKDLENLRYWQEHGGVVKNE